MFEKWRAGFKSEREKLQGSEDFGWQIRTVWGVGYKFEVK